MAIHRLCCAYFQCCSCPRRSMDVSHFTFMHKDHRDSERKYYRASRRKNDLISRIFLLTPLALIIGNVFITILLTRASLENYPGGQALAIFHQSFSNNNTRKQSIFLNLHLDVVSSSSSLSPTPYPYIQFSSSKRRFSVPSTPFLSSLLPSTSLHYP